MKICRSRILKKKTKKKINKKEREVKAGLTENLPLDLSCQKEWGRYIYGDSLGTLVLRCECAGLMNAGWLRAGLFLQ